MSSLSRDRKAGNQVRRTGVIIAIVAAVAFVVAQTSPLVRGSVRPARAGMDDIVVATAESMPTKSGFSLFSDAALKDELEQLKTENRQLAIWRDTAIAMSERLRRYEEMLGLESEPLPAGVSARVVTETNGPFAETRLANAGARNGVREGHIAVNTQGVVGRVIRVGNRSARILLVSDFNSRVPVMGEFSGVRAILAGGQGEYGQLIDQPERADFIPGENLLTTGEGNAFPRGLRVGVAQQDDAGWRALLAMSEAPLDFVRLLPQISVERPEKDPVGSESSEATAPTETEG